MTTIPAKVEARLVSGLKKFQTILNAAKSKDINESDTVVIVTDILAELFGFDKYADITSEYSIKKTFCDLAIKIDSKVRFLIEVKAVGLTLKDEHIKQAVDYGANAGIDWVILTNGYIWKIYKIIFGKPIENDLVYEFDLLNISAKKSEDLEHLYYVCKESFGKSILENYHMQKQALSKFMIGQIILTAPVVEAIRKIIRKISPEIRISNEDISEVMPDVLKREVLEGDKAIEAKKKIQKSLKSIEQKEEPA